jgi:hypothetical protein
MKRASMAGVFALCLGLTVACGGNKDEADIAERDPKVGDRGDGRPMAITETGCLTAQGDRFVLTALESAAAAGTAKPEPGAAGSQKPGQGAAESRSADAQPTTESYQLIGNEDELRPLVGKQVRVSGEADPPKVAAAEGGGSARDHAAQRSLGGDGNGRPGRARQARRTAGIHGY